jgi:hypothetical protein
MSEHISPQPDIQDEVWLEVTGQLRWSIYSRLQQLGIDCHCRSGQPLQVRIDSACDLMQCWSVCRHSNWDGTTPARLRDWLGQCWAVEVTG